MLIYLEMVNNGVVTKKCIFVAVMLSFFGMVNSRAATKKCLFRFCKNNFAIFQGHAVLAIVLKPAFPIVKVS